MRYITKSTLWVIGTSNVKPYIIRPSLNHKGKCCRKARDGDDWEIVKLIVVNLLVIFFLKPIYIHIYMCIYIYIYIYIYVYIYIHIHTYTHTYTHIYKHIYANSWLARISKSLKQTSSINKLQVFNLCKNVQKKGSRLNFKLHIYMVFFISILKFKG